MTAMSGAFDWLAVGDVGEARGAGRHPSLGGAAARLAAQATALGASVAIVGKVGDDDAGRRVRALLARAGVDLAWLRDGPAARTTVWIDADGPSASRRIDRGADLGLRLDELPPRSVTAAMTIVSGYSLSVEPARSAAIGALAGAARRGGRSGLLLEADVLWSTNARMARRVLEPALATADSVALTHADATALLGPTTARQAVKTIAQLGPRIVYLGQPDGSILVREGSRLHAIPALDDSPQRADRFAGPAAFWVALARGESVAEAASGSLRPSRPSGKASRPRGL